MRQALLVAIAIIAVGLGSARAAQPAAATCAPYTKPIVLDFKTQMPAVIYNNNLNVNGIRNLFRLRGLALGGPHDRALGVTAIDTLLSLAGASTLIPTRGGYCLYVNTLTARFGWKRMEVFVAADYPRDTCEYRVVLDHENQHAAINRETTLEFAPLVRADLERILREMQPMLVADPNGAADAALQGIQRGLAAISDQHQSTMNKRNAVIDTSHNYDATFALCANWSKEGRKQ
jgi:hypothetical protein